MAITSNEILLKIKPTLDTNEFDGSMASMKKEMRELKNGIGNNLLSKEDQSVLLGRMAQLKDEIGDISAATSKVKGFEILAKTIGPVISSLGAAVGAAKALGVQWKGLEQAETIMMTTMNAAMALQQLKDLSELKGILASKGARLASILAINVETEAVGLAAAAQRVWNAAIAANPIGLMVTAIAAVVAAISGLIFWYRSHNVVSEETKKQLKDLVKGYEDFNKVIEDNTASYIKNIEERRAKLRGASDAELQIISENADFKVRMDELITAHSAKQTQLRLALKKAESDGDDAFVLDAYTKAIEMSNKRFITEVKLLGQLHETKVDLIKKQGIVDEDAKKKNEKDVKKEVSNLGKTWEEMYFNWDAWKKKMEEPVKIKVAEPSEEDSFTPDNFKGVITITEDMVKAQDDYNNSLLRGNEALQTFALNSMGSFEALGTSALNFYNLMNSAASTPEKIAAGLEALKEISIVVFDEIAKGNETTFNAAMNSLNKQFETQYVELDKLLKSKQISEAEYQKRKDKLDADRAKKEKELKKEKFKKDKEAAIIQALINTALGVTAALTQQPAGIALAIITGLMGAAEIAVIASQPTPEFGSGGKLSGPSHSMGGVPIIAEGGEYMIQKSVVGRPGMESYLNYLNNGGVPNQNMGVSLSDIQLMFNEYNKIPVVNVESESTRVQKKVQNIETAASWG